MVLAAAGAGAPAFGADEHRVWMDWALNCQGCHQSQGAGIPGSTPALRGQVARFTSTPEGREYLARVPGVASAPLSDADLAELLNWLLVRFDPHHLSLGFKPYSAEEVGRLRARPLRSDAAELRAKLVRGWAENGEAQRVNR